MGSRRGWRGEGVEWGAEGVPKRGGPEGGSRKGSGKGGQEGGPERGSGRGSVRGMEKGREEGLERVYGRGSQRWVRKEWP